MSTARLKIGDLRRRSLGGEILIGLPQLDQPTDGIGQFGLSY
jgi:hypothetical protein